jgi:hypothetical protein
MEANAYSFNHKIEANDMLLTSIDPLMNESHCYVTFIVG